MVDLNGHEAGNGGHSQGKPTAYRDSSTRRDAILRQLRTSSKMTFTRTCSTPECWKSGATKKRNLIARGELIGSVVLVVIGIAFIALAPAKPVERASAAVV